MSSPSPDSTDASNPTRTPRSRPRRRFQQTRVAQPTGPNPNPAPQRPETCDTHVESETSAASPAHRPASDFQLLTSNSQLLASTPPPRRTGDNTGQNETFADAPNPNTPAHLPASDVQLLTSNSQLLISISISPESPPPKTYEICVESETFGDTITPNIWPPPEPRRSRRADSRQPLWPVSHPKRMTNPSKV